MSIAKNKFYVIVWIIKIIKGGQKMFPSFGEKSMERLESSIGEQVEIDFVARKTPVSVLGKIKDVERFRFIEVEDATLLKPLSLDLAAGFSAKKSIKIPFVWPGSAIQKIVAEEILYDNFWIDERYDQLDPLKVFELAEILYGKKTAQTLVELKQIVEENKKSIFKFFYT